MGQRLKRKKQPPRVLRHMHEQMIPAAVVVEREPAPPGGIPVGRLELFQQFFDFDPAVVAESLRYRADGIILCDSTVCLAPTDDRIWDALLGERRLALIPPIIDEIWTWSADPRGINVEASRIIAAHLEHGDSSHVRTLDVPPTQELVKAAVYYINLLGIRKHLAAIARRRLERELGRPVNAQEISNHIQQNGGPRAQLLSNQGQDVKVKEHLCNDERLVVAALLSAILTREEATIITSDEAVLDQFMKATCLMSWHYLAMNLADCYARSPAAFNPRVVDNPNDKVFRGEKIILLNKPSPQCLELLPRRPKYVMAHCMLLDPKDVTRVSVNLEMEMRRMLETKGRTGGLTTDLFDGMNCHLFLTPESRANVGADTSAIVLDKTAPIGNTGMHLATTDLGHALDSNEQYVQVAARYRESGHKNAL